MSRSASDITPLEIEVQIRKTAQSSTHIIDIDETDAEHFLSRAQKRILIHFPNGAYFHRAVQKSKGRYFISLGKDTVRQAQVEVGQVLTVRLEADTSEYGMPFPEEFQELLLQDPEAKDRWGELTAGKKRSLLHYISSGKSIDTRINRSLQMAERLKQGL